MDTTAIDRTWIALEFLKSVQSERSLATAARSRAESPPVPNLGVLYREIADQDERHVVVLETIATRYGHTPSRSSAGGVGETLGRLKDQVVALGADPIDRLRQDLNAKSDALQWLSAWSHALQTIEDVASARDLDAVVDRRPSPSRRPP